MRHCGASPVVPCSRSFCGCRSSAEISLTFRVTPPHTRQIVVSWWNSQLLLMGAPSSRRVVLSPPHSLISAVGHSLAENPNFPPFSTLSRTFSSFLSGFVIGISLVSEPKKEAFLRPEACPPAAAGFRFCRSNWPRGGSFSDRT